MIRLSIIIPCYNAEPYIYELLDTLTPQITDEVEVILIDDGSKKPIQIQKVYPWLNVVRQENKGVSAARNRGLEMAKGDIIGFIDADDLVSEKYVLYILSRADEEWDYMDLSWKSLENDRYIYKLRSDSDSLPNPSASTRVFRREFIGDTRFPEKKDVAEDEHFTRHLGLKNAKHICATDIMYYYRITTPDSASKTFFEGKKNVKRIAYYFSQVRSDMTYLIDEFKREDEENEVYLLTYDNQIPELEKYCQVFNPPRTVRAMEGRGESSHFVSLIPIPLKTQVVIYTKAMRMVGGVEAFVYNFCMTMHDYYDITVLYEDMDLRQVQRLLKTVRVLKHNPDKPIMCDTLIMNRIFDEVPKNVSYKQIVQMTHCIKQNDWHIPQNRDVIVNVSEVSRESFGEEAGTVIHNLLYQEKVTESLLLVSAMRVGADDKQGNDDRCIKFARMLKEAKIPFMWMYFADRRLHTEVDGMFYGGCVLDAKPYIKKADYFVQLSGAEAFSYSMLEALSLGTPLICTDLAQNKEMGIVDGENAYVLPLDLSGFDVDCLLDKLHFNYTYSNRPLIKQWRKILGDTVPVGDYTPQDEVEVEVVRTYFDLLLQETLECKKRKLMAYERAIDLQGKGLVKLV